MTDEPRPGQESPPAPQADPTIVYEVELFGGANNVELPFVVGVIGDFSAARRREPAPARKFLSLSPETFDAILPQGQAEPGDPSDHSEKSRHGLRQLVEQAGADPYVRVRALDITKADLAASFRGEYDIARTEVFRLVYENEYGQFGGEPYGIILVGFEFGHDSFDVSLLENLAKLGAAAMCTFVAPAAPRLFAVERWADLVRRDDLESIFTSSAYVDWRALRELDEARHLVLTVSNVARAQSDRSPSEIYALAARLMDIYAQTRGWDLTGAIAAPDPAPIYSSSQRAELVRCGFLPVGHTAAGSDEPIELRTLQRAKRFHDPEAAAFAAASALFPYGLTTSQFGRAIKCMARDAIGSFASDAEMEHHLQGWINNYIVDETGTNQGAVPRPGRPLAEAHVEVANLAGLTRNSGARTVILDLRPRLPGADFSRSTCYKLAVPSARAE